MATANISGGDEGPTTTACARDFVLDRLRESDSPLSPAELADEYGCTNGHVRNTLRELREDDLADRVGRGQYVALDADESADMDSEGPAVPTPTTTDAEPEEGADFPEDGGPQSEDTDTAETAGPEQSDPFEGRERLREFVEKQNDPELREDIIEDLDDPSVDVHDSIGGSFDQWESEQEDVDEDRDAGVVEDSDGVGGIPIPVSPKVLIAGSLVLLLAVYWFRVRPAGEDDEEDDETAQQGQQDVPAGPQGGFMGD